MLAVVICSSSHILNDIFNIFNSKLTLPLSKPITKGALHLGTLLFSLNVYEEC